MSRTSRERVEMLCQAPDRAGQFYRKLFSDIFHYAAMRVPEIADDIVSIDNAMKWGFDWECGPFELWDAVGVEKVVEAWEKSTAACRRWWKNCWPRGGKSFYRLMRRRPQLLRFGQRPPIIELPERPGVLLLPALKARKKEVKKNAGASLIDLGDGVLCLEFHSKMNTIGGDTVQMVHAGLKALDEGFDAMVIGNQAPNFCVGANLMLVLTAIQEGEWDEVHQRRARLPKRQHGAEIRAQAGGGGALRNDAGRRNGDDVCTPRACAPRRRPTWDWWKPAWA